MSFGIANDWRIIETRKIVQRFDNMPHVLNS